jgi:hypothetical protein
LVHLNRKMQNSTNADYVIQLFCLSDAAYRPTRFIIYVTGVHLILLRSPSSMSKRVEYHQISACFTAFVEQQPLSTMHRPINRGPYMTTGVHILSMETTPPCTVPHLVDSPTSCRHIMHYFDNLVLFRHIAKIYQRARYFVHTNQNIISWTPYINKKRKDYHI